jgi:hypothetical protein
MHASKDSMWRKIYCSFAKFSGSKLGLRCRCVNQQQGMAVWLDGPCVKSTHTALHRQLALARDFGDTEAKGEAQHSQEIKMRYRGHVLDHDSAQVQHGMQCNAITPLTSDDWHGQGIIGVLCSIWQFLFWAAAAELQPAACRETVSDGGSASACLSIIHVVPLGGGH